VKKKKMEMERSEEEIFHEIAQDLFPIVGDGAFGCANKTRREANSQLLMRIHEKFECLDADTKRIVKQRYPAVYHVIEVSRFEELKEAEFKAAFEELDGHFEEWYGEREI
jgi:hypothetical protein